MNRKEREMLRRKNEIIEAARQLFTEKGIEEVTMDEIAKRAEFTRRTLYSYFQSKIDLVVEVVLKAFSLAADNFLSIRSLSCNPYEKLVELAKIYLQFFKDNPIYYSLLQQCDLAIHNDRDKLSPGVLQDIEADPLDIDSIAQQCFEEGVQDGIFYEDVRPDLAATFFFKSLYGIVHQYVLHPQFPEGDFYIELHYLLRGLTKQTEVS